MPPSLAPSSAPPPSALTRLASGAIMATTKCWPHRNSRKVAKLYVFRLWPSFRPCLSGFCVDSPTEWYGGGRLVRQHAELLMERVEDLYQTVTLALGLDLVRNSLNLVLLNLSMR